MGISETEFDHLRCFKWLNDLVFSPINVFLKESYPKVPWFGARTRNWQQMAMLCPPKTTTPKGFRNSRIAFARNFAKLEVFKGSGLGGVLGPEAVMVSPGLPHQLHVGPGCKTSGETSTILLLPILPLLTCKRRGGAIHSSTQTWMKSFPKSRGVHRQLGFLLQPYLKMS